jgi:hypothetical protein
MTNLVPVEVEAAKEPWSDYRLADGTTLKVRVVLVEVHRRDGEFAPDGEPLYEVKMTTIVNARAPDHLKDPARRAPEEE